MEAEHCPPRDADAIAGNRAQHQGASGQARPVDDDPFAGLSHAGKNLKISVHRATRISESVKVDKRDVGRRWTR